MKPCRLPLRLACAVAALAFATAAAAQTTRPTAAVAYRDFDRTAIAEGVVEAVRQSALAAQTPGRVVARPVKAGDAVKAGQVLVQVDARSALQAEAASQGQVREAQANLINAKARFERAERLFAQKFVSQAAVDQARAEYLAAQAQSATAGANAAVAATTTSYATIVAPYDGVVASADVEVGDMAIAGRTLIVVFDPRDLRVSATLPQALLAEANLDAPIKVEIPAQKRALTARKVTVIPVADTRAHTTRVRLDLPQAAGLMPGQYARAAIVVGHARALAVPDSAVLRRSEVTAVYVIDANERAQLRQVRLGEPTGDGWVEVLAGLNAGERVATDPVRAGIEASRDGDRRS